MAVQMTSGSDACPREIAGFLGTWSCHLDLPVWIARTHVTELATGGMQVDWTAPFGDTELHIAPAGTVHAEFKAYAGLFP